MIRILVEGWMTYPHSYALVNIYQMLALARMPEVKLYFSECKPYKEDWSRIDDLTDISITAEEQSILNCVERWNGQSVDVVYRIAYPFDLDSKDVASGCPLVLFYTSEYQKFQNVHFLRHSVSEFVDQCMERKVIPVTPSNWSAVAMRKLKYDPVVIPHGVDVTKYHPLEERDRRVVRNEMGIPEEAFVFLNVGAMTGNKNIKLCIKTFYRVSLLKSNVYLVLKGIGDLYSCRENINAAIKQLVEEKAIHKKQWGTIAKKLIFIDELYSFREMCKLYNAADCYLSPYLAEGFNLPALESIACGTPVIVSKGGPTDDFTDDRVAKYPRTFSVQSGEEAVLLVDEEVRTGTRRTQVYLDTRG